MSITGWWNRITQGRPQDGSAAASTALGVRSGSTAAQVAPAATVDAETLATEALATEALATEALATETSEARNVRFCRWLLAVPADAKGGGGAAIDAMFERLDEVIASESLRNALLPRTPHVVPQLMKTLRDDRYSAADVASRISKDVVLTAAVVRSATGAFQSDDSGEEIDLARAVSMIGTQGLRRAIASVVMRPIFDARGDSLSARAADQIWRDADRKARLGAAIAGEAGLDPFDGYLAGLLHNSGWTAMLRAIDSFQGVSVGAAQLARADVVPRLRLRRDALFGALIEPWQLDPAIDALAAEVGRIGVDAAQTPLGAALRSAEELAARYALAPAGLAPKTVVPGWAELPLPVRDCYLALSTPDPD